MCDGKSTEIKRIGNTIYNICDKCGKPIRGTGRTAGGMAIWVTKDYVKAKKRVPFSDRWLALCESVGFRLVCKHKAMLAGLNSKGEYVERKSFFRRLAESKGSPRIDYEEVICLEK